MYSLSVGRSKTGLPTITESGGSATNTGSAIVICGASGEKIKPLFIPRGYSNGDHAIFVASVGMHIVETEHSRRGESATVYRIDAIGKDDDEDAVVYHEVASYEDGDGNIPAEFQAAVDAALEKAHCYHCREPHFIGAA
jgi:hypothetical protein